MGKSRNLAELGAGKLNTHLIPVSDSAYVIARASIPSIVDSAYVTARYPISTIVDSAYVIARSPAITAGITSYLYTATAGQLVFAGPDDNGNTLDFTSNNVFVNINGVMIVETLDYTLTPSNTVTTVTGLSAGDQLSVTVFAPASSENLTSIFDSSYLSSRLSTIYPSEITQREYVYTANASQLTFTGADSSGTSLAYNSDNVEVFANGIRLFKSIDYTASTGTSIVLADSMGIGSSIVIVDRSSLFGLDITKSLNIGTESIPSTSTSTGIKGTVLTDATHMYVCTATNVWVRSSIDTSW